MDRRSFLKELVQSLTDTGKEIVSPFIEHDMDKLGRAADVLNGLGWHRLDPVSPGYSEQVCGSRLVCLYYNDGRLTACGKYCPDCRELLAWIAYDHQLHCPACGKNYSFTGEEQSLKPELYEVRNERGSWCVALPEGSDTFHA
jgi:hypothetical protein